MSYYDPLPPDHYDPPADDDLTEVADDDERHWRAIAEVLGPEHDDD